MSMKREARRRHGKRLDKAQAREEKRRADELQWQRQLVEDFVAASEAYDERRLAELVLAEMFRMGGVEAVENMVATLEQQVVFE